VPDWIGLDRAREELAAMSTEQRSNTPPLIPPRDVVEMVLELVRDDSCSGSVVELWGGEPPLLVPPMSRPNDRKPGGRT
jgi:hypothetical protein